MTFLGGSGGQGGNQFEQTIGNPGAGNPAIFTIPGSMGVVELITGFCVVTTSAVVKTRTPTLRIQDPSGNTVVDVVQQATQPANNSSNMTWGQGLSAVGQAASGVYGTSPFPRIFLSQFWQIQFRILNIDPADTITSAIVLLNDV